MSSLNGQGEPKPRQPIGEKKKKKEKKRERKGPKRKVERIYPRLLIEFSETK